MPATSVAQRRFFAGWEHNPKQMRGKKPDMSIDQLHDFAATPETGLPQRVESPVKSAMKKAMRKKAKK